MDQAQRQEAAERVQRMEACFDHLRLAVQADPSARQEAWFREELRKLLEYYEGGQWLQDFQLDEAGGLPAQLKRGVLSEDGVYNFLASLEE